MNLGVRYDEEIGNTEEKLGVNIYEISSKKTLIKEA